MHRLLWRYLSETKTRLKACWAVRQSAPEHLKPGTKEYVRRAQEEVRSCEEMPASSLSPTTQAGGLRHISNLPASWGRSPTCPCISSQLVRHYSKVFSRDDAEGHRSRQTLLEPAPAAWAEIQRRCWEFIRQATGNDLTGHLLARLQSRPKVRMVSLGSGPGGCRCGSPRPISTP